MSNKVNTDFETDEVNSENNENAEDSDVCLNCLFAQISEYLEFRKEIAEDLLEDARKDKDAEGIEIFESEIADITGMLQKIDVVAGPTTMSEQQPYQPFAPAIARRDPSKAFTGDNTIVVCQIVADLLTALPPSELSCDEFDSFAERYVKGNMSDDDKKRISQVCEKTGVTDALIRKVCEGAVARKENDQARGIE